MNWQLSMLHVCRSVFFTLRALSQRFPVFITTHLTSHPLILSPYLYRIPSLHLSLSGVHRDVCQAAGSFESQAAVRDCGDPPVHAAPVAARRKGLQGKDLCFIAAVSLLKNREEWFVLFCEWCTFLLFYVKFVLLAECISCSAHSAQHTTLLYPNIHCSHTCYCYYLCSRCWMGTAWKTCVACICSLVGSRHKTCYSRPGSSIAGMRYKAHLCGICN